MIPGRADKLSSSVPDQLFHVSIVLTWRHLKLFKNIRSTIKQLAENILPVCTCLDGLLGFIKAKRYFIFSYVY